MGRRRGSLLEWIWNAVQHGERRIIRVMVLTSVILVLMQLSAVKDPLQFYLAVAAKVEAPPLDLPALAETDQSQSSQTWKITLKAVPAAPISVLQNGNVIGSLTKGELQINVKSGEIQLDGTEASELSRVQVIYTDSQLKEPALGAIFIIQENIRTITVSP